MAFAAAHALVRFCADGRPTSNFRLWRNFSFRCSPTAHTNAAGRIDEFTVMLRLLKAMHTFEAKMRVEFERAMHAIAADGEAGA